MMICLSDTEHPASWSRVFTLYIKLAIGCCSVGFHDHAPFVVLFEENNGLLPSYICTLIAQRRVAPYCVFCMEYVAE